MTRWRTLLRTVYKCHVEIRLILPLSSLSPPLSSVLDSTLIHARTVSILLFRVTDSASFRCMLVI